jgi:hypothetical protein
MEVPLIPPPVSHQGKPNHGIQEISTSVRLLLSLSRRPDLILTFVRYILSCMAQ